MSSLFPPSPAASITALPRRYIWVAVGFVGAAGVMAVRRYLDGKRAQAEDEETRGPARATTETTANAPRSTTPPPPRPAARPVERSAADEAEIASLGGGARELAEFLAGDSWFDESGWTGIWEREGISEPTAWLRERGLQVLKRERAKLAEHPALLAGCRRRWIVVCRYAGVDVGEAASLWNETDA